MKVSRSTVRVLAASVVILVFGMGWWHHLRAAVQGRLEFDDAYMFQRYAWHVRQGLGMAWNNDGVPTYGMTALLWGVVVLGLSFLPGDLSHEMVVAGVLLALGAMVAVAWAVSANAVSGCMSWLGVAFVCVAGPLWFNVRFAANATNGMETMLAALLCAVFVGVALEWSRGRVRSESVGVVGWLLVLARPEAVVVVVLLPVMVFALMPLAGKVREEGSVELPDVCEPGSENPDPGHPAFAKGLGKSNSAMTLVRVLGVFAGLVVVELVVCRWYFGSALPLAFYLKAARGYEGYRKNWYPMTGAWRMVSGCCVFVVALVLCARRSDWRLVMACLVPLAAVFAVLLRVTQIMGFESRYYMPYAALLVVPALLVVDRRLAGSREVWQVPVVAWHGVAAVVVAAVCLSARPVNAVQAMDRRVHAGTSVYEDAEVQTDAGGSLPELEYGLVLRSLTATLVAPLPRGVKIAASEVGYLGASASQADIIDLVGLNDTDIALHGFDVERLLVRRPDLIWMPHWDYTYERGLMLGSPALLEQYEVYAGAANYGIAVRKDSVYRAQIEARVQAMGREIYPGLTMQEYLVRSASWTGQKYRVGIESSEQAQR